MKKILLIPSLTAICLAPIASLVGCNPQTPSEVHKVVIDPSSDTADIAISTPEITLNTELVIPYEIINQEKELDADAS
ncbi:MAG: hypothetical protein MJ233_04745 [Mycoplasmoidaceae bacterium]|nr:hypothetical protein [Mycoplasmoidaceae bacterium]